jgi:hypothetical protein
MASWGLKDATWTWVGDRKEKDCLGGNPSCLRRNPTIEVVQGNPMLTKEQAFQLGIL